MCNQEIHSIAIFLAIIYYLALQFNNAQGCVNIFFLNFHFYQPKLTYDHSVERTNFGIKNFDGYFLVSTITI